MQHHRRKCKITFEKVISVISSYRPHGYPPILTQMLNNNDLKHNIENRSAAKEIMSGLYVDETVQNELFTLLISISTIYCYQ